MFWKENCIQSHDAIMYLLKSDQKHMFPNEKLTRPVIIQEISFNFWKPFWKSDWLQPDLFFDCIVQDSIKTGFVIAVCPLGELNYFECHRSK